MDSAIGFSSMLAIGPEHFSYFPAQNSGPNWIAFITRRGDPCRIERDRWTGAIGEVDVRSSQRRLRPKHFLYDV